MGKSNKKKEEVEVKMERDGIERLLYNVFVGMVYDAEDKPVQSLMYHIFDIGALGLEGSNGKEDSVRRFKNIVSQMMKSIYGKYVGKGKNLETLEDAAKIFVVMNEVVGKELLDLCGYMFGRSEEAREKSHYLVKKVEEVSEDLVSQLRAGELVVK